MKRLGSKQLGLLATMAGVGRALVAPDAVSRSLCARGLMEPTGTTPETADAFIAVTPSGFRAVADAMEAGLISNKPDLTRGAKP